MIDYAHQRDNDRLRIMGDLKLRDNDRLRTLIMGDLKLRDNELQSQNAQISFRSPIVQGRMISQTKHAVQSV